MSDKRIIDAIFSVFALFFYGALFFSLLYAAARLGYVADWLKSFLSP